MSFLHFASLIVRRMPGIADGGWQFDALASGINVVYGPNASGKTTTARAFEALLWPGTAPDSAWVEATMLIGAEEWWAELDTKRAIFQRNGELAPSPNVLPAESRDRYHLPLYQLLTGDDENLARAIALESAGGFDLGAAQEIIGPRRSLSRPKSHQDALRAARERLRRARAIQENLQSETANMAEDEARLAKRPDREQRLHLLEMALRHYSIVEEARGAARRLSAFHPAIAKLVGDEQDHFRELRDRLIKSERAVSAAADRIDQARIALTEGRFPNGFPEREGLAALGQELAALHDADVAIRSMEEGIEESRSQMAVEAERLGILSDPERVAVLDPETLHTFVSAARATHEAASRRAAIDAEIRAVGSVEASGDASRLEKGAHLLQLWSGVPRTASARLRQARMIAFASAFVVIVTGAALSLLWVWALAISAMGVALLVALVQRPGETDLRGVHRQQFEQLELDVRPERWEADSVRECLDGIGNLIAEARLAEALRARLGPLEQRAREAMSEEAQHRDRLAEITSVLGIPEGAEAELILLLERISKLQDLRNALARNEGRKLVRERQRTEILRRANAHLTEAGVEEVTDLPSLRARLEALTAAVEKKQEIEATIRDAQTDIRHFEAAGAEAKRELERLRERLVVEALDEGELSRWCEQRPEMMEARRTFDGIEEQRKRLERELREAHGFDEEMLSPRVDDIRLEIQKVRAELDQLDVLRDRVVQLRTQVERAKQGHDIEEALAEVDRAESALREARDRDARAHLAMDLVAFVEEQSRNEHRPEVFHRADRLFSTITRGRYRLRLNDAQDPTFQAFDTQRQRSQPLVELSSATRVQLLLAVRLAFVEAQESGVRLPLLLDETLANSDSERAGAIIDALVALAETGRQIFYFTAQVDEVRKWQSVLPGHENVDSRVFDLAEIRRVEQSLDPEEMERIVEEPVRFPSPNGGGHAEYGELLSIPALDPHGPSAAIHLWYLLDDPEVLYEVMSTLSVETLGAFRSLTRDGVEDLIAPQVVRRVESTGAVADAILHQLRIGRGRRLDRHALVASGAVTSHFLDDISELARSVGGDSLELIEALENKAVSGFGEKRTESLRVYLEEEGYIDTRPQLRPEQIRLEVFRDTGRIIASGDISREDVERLLTRLGVRVRRQIQSVQEDLQLWG